MPIKWEPFQEPKRNSNMPNSFESENWLPFMPMMKNENPAIDIYQDKNNLYIEISLIGVNPEDVQISIKDNILTIQSEKEEGISSKGAAPASGMGHASGVKEKDYLIREIKKGSFRRVVKLPVEVKSNKASAESLEGILKITVPKIAKANSNAKKIPIKIK